MDRRNLSPGRAMRAKLAMLAAIFLASAVVRGCGGGSGGSGNGGGANITSAPTVSTAGAQNGALIVRLASATPGAVIFYTVDESTPTPSSQQYQAPFLVTSNLAVNAIAVAAAPSPLTPSTVTSQSFAPNIPAGTLVWSDEFTNNTGAPARPDPAVWTYDTGNSGFGNQELETYCADRKSVV